MKKLSLFNGMVGVWLWLVAAGAFGLAPHASARIEEHFDLLQIGTHTYRNVTVTTKAKDYIFILYTGGMGNVRVADLSPEVRKDLGYSEPEAPAPSTVKSAGAWAQKTLAKVETPQLKNLEQQWAERLGAGQKLSFPRPSGAVLWGGLAALVTLYFFGCFCCQLICQKAGRPPGALVWVPLVQLVPLLRAAGMSAWWFWACLVPGLNLLAQIVWSVKIVQARGKGMLTVVALLLPGLNLLGLLYLAFSSGTAAPPKRSSAKVELMTLETA